MSVFATKEFARFAHKANISAKELKALKRLAEVMLGFTFEQLQAAKDAGEIEEVVSDGDEKEERRRKRPCIRSQDGSRPA